MVIHQRLGKVLIVSSLLMCFGISAVLAAQTGSAPEQLQQQPAVTPTPTALPVQTLDLAYGETVNVDVSGGAVQVNFTLNEATVVDIIVRGGGTTDPRMYLFTAADRPLALSDDHSANRDDLNDFDAYLQDVFLLPGGYNLRIEGEGAGNVEVSVTEGDLSTIGQLTIVSQTLNQGERFYQPLTLAAGELVSIIAYRASGNLDPRLNLRDAAGVRLARNDDADSFDPILNMTDAKIEHFIAPEAGVYQVDVRGFNPSESGEFLFMVMQYGTLQAVEEPVQRYSGRVLSQQRVSYPIALEAGEVITVIGRAAASPVDAQIRLLDPDNILVAGNDDHDTGTEGLQEFDAMFSDYIVKKTGTYTLEFESVSGVGAYELIVQRRGKLDPAVISDPVISSTGIISTPTPEPIAPEATAEANS